MSENVLVFEPSKTTHWKNLFPSKTQLLGSHNLNEGEELVAEIVEVKVEKIKDQNGREEQVPIIRFTNAPPMVLNITNSKTISALYGDLYTGWKGRSIQLYATKIKAFGEETMALRVRKAIPNTNIDTTQYANQLRACKNMEELKQVFTKLPIHVKPLVENIKDEMKGKLNAGS